MESILKKIVDGTNSKFKDAAEIDPDLKKKASTVLSSRSGQCPPTNEPMGIIKEFPKAVGPDDSVKRIRELLDLKAQAIKEGKGTSAFDTEINDLVSSLTFKDDVNVELRFNPGTLDYGLIQKIYESSFIDKTFTKSPLAPVLFNVNNFLNQKA